MGKEAVVPNRRYTEEFKAGAAIRLSAEVDQNWVTIRVIDSGVGIADDMGGRLFQMFSLSSDPLRRSECGLGSDLALAKGLVELHGGTIRGKRWTLHEKSIYRPFAVTNGKESVGSCGRT